MLRWVAVLCAAGSAWPSGVQAKDYHLLPSSNWLMDYAPDSCELSRSFGTGDDKLIVQFTRYEPGPYFDFNLVGKPLGRPSNYPPVRVRFGATGEFVATPAMGGTGRIQAPGSGLPDKVPAVYLSGRLDNLDWSKLDSADLKNKTQDELRRLSVIEPATEVAVTNATIRVGNRTIVVALGSMGPPMAAMRKCTTDLLKLWGLDPVQIENLKCGPTPRSNPSYWLRSEDYPSDSLANGEQAIIRFRLMVSAAGEVTSCAVQSAIAKGDFADVSCRLLKQRAKFEPALASDGTAAAAYYVGKVIWRMM